MNSSTHKFESADLSWNAFRYVAGEMSPEESAQFESLLADNLDACEAVANVTELSLSTRTVLESQATPLIRHQPVKSSRNAHRVAVIASLAALGLLIAVVMVPDQTSPSRDSSVSSIDRDRSEDRSVPVGTSSRRSPDSAGRRGH